MPLVLKETRVQLAHQDSQVLLERMVNQVQTEEKVLQAAREMLGHLVKMAQRVPKEKLDQEVGAL